MRSRAALLLVATAALLGGCGAPAAAATPAGSLTALAAAVSANDPAAVDRLICPAARDQGHTMAQVRDGLVELDPAYRTAAWRAQAGPITGQDATTATGSLTITRTGWPATTSPLVEDYLAANEVPRPLNLLGAGGEITLVRQGGSWLACGPGDAG